MEEKGPPPDSDSPQTAAPAESQFHASHCLPITSCLSSSLPLKLLLRGPFSPMKLTSFSLPLTSPPHDHTTLTTQPIPHPLLSPLLSSCPQTSNFTFCTQLSPFSTSFTPAHWQLNVDGEIPTPTLTHDPKQSLMWPSHPITCP